MNYLVTGHGIHVHLNSVLVQKEYFFPMEQAQDITTMKIETDKLTPFSCEMQLSFSVK